jgi:hypothetical protein
MTPLIPSWIGVPLGMLMIVVVSMHISWLLRSRQPASRRRIRLANGVLMFLTIPLLTTGFSILAPRAHTRAWMLVWIAAMAMLAGVVFFAMLDALNTVRLQRRARRRAIERLRLAIYGGKKRG